MPASFSVHIRPARAALLILCLFSAYLVGFNFAEAPPPTVVAVVDLLKLFDGLKVRLEAEAAIKVLAEQMADEAKIKVAQAERLGEDLKLYTPGTKDFVQAEDKFKRANIEARVFLQFQKFKIEQRKNDDIKKIYENIKKSIAAYSKLHGYDVVIMDDSIVPFTPGPQANVMEQISARRVLYADEKLDITKPLMKWINDQNPAAPAPAPAAAKP